MGKLDTINVGNLAHKEGAIQIKSNIKVVEEEIEAFKKLNEMGVVLTAKMVPDDPETDFMTYLNKVLELKTREENTIWVMNYFFDAIEEMIQDVRNTQGGE